MNTNTSKKAGMIGTVNPSMDVKVGDLIQVRAIEGISRKNRRDTDVVIEDHGAFVEILATHTIKVESVDTIGTSLWCKGAIVETDGHAPLGNTFPAYLGAL
ncbi:hypothetical protein SEA_FRANKLIN22_33 [Microbacterium phage Franklin22]|uniref:hypothetical protein n=1 Tax=Microbacterium phage Franklin22 TaxID=2894293 RepID=UPI001E6C72F6|nr:hypothetical protein QDW15_gp33 [Microbacterium phage Franklin22]UGL61846.1 hypothetical protein SEA_FRANKLIN22_33 [Microbacterium phage Franklin22]